MDFFSKCNMVIRSEMDFLKNGIDIKLPFHFHIKDIKNTFLDKVDENELEKRRKSLKPFEPKVKSGYLYKYSKNVQDASHGAIV